MKPTKKYLLVFAILIVLSPLGILLPRAIHAGDAWGEWSVESVKEQTGIEPEGMKKDAALYKAPVSGYNLGKENDSLPKLSLNYIFSGLIGSGIILTLTFGMVKWMSRNKTE